MWPFKRNTVIRVAWIAALPSGDPCVLLEFPGCKGLPPQYHPTHSPKSERPRAGYAVIAGDELTIAGREVKQTRKQPLRQYSESSGTVTPLVDDECPTCGEEYE